MSGARDRGFLISSCDDMLHITNRTTHSYAYILSAVLCRWVAIQTDPAQGEGHAMHVHVYTRTHTLRHIY